MKADDLRPHGVPKKTEIVHLVQTINVVVEICMPDTMHTTIPSTTEGCPQYLKRTMTVTYACMRVWSYIDITRSTSSFYHAACNALAARSSARQFQPP